VAKAIQGRIPVGGVTAEFDSGFVTTVKAPAEDNCMVLPLVVKEKVAAILYADGGTAPGGILDASGLTALSRFAAVWLELTALRKTGGHATAEDTPVAAPTGHGAPPAGAAQPSEEDELHKKARRFAKLLVEEIKLYNQPKVDEGKLHRDLYDRLKADIEKSRATYDKRYSDSPVASADYFTQELVRILADNDISIMGAAFPR
jgi:hypothetical protein